MSPTHALRALAVMNRREVVKFIHQRGRLLSALVRPLLWLIVFAAGFQNVFGVSIVPPYRTYILYQDYILPGLLGIVLLFHGMQSSLSMVYDREMGVMRLLLTAPLPRWYLLLCKLIAGTTLSIIQAYLFLALAWLLDVTIPPLGWITVLPALIVAGLMLGALGLLLSVNIRQMENFAGMMNFVIFPMFFISTALYPLWKLKESGAVAVWWLARINPFTHAVELVRFALFGQVDLVAAAVTLGCGVVFFLAAAWGYNPQRGMIRRGPGPAGN
jgi:ABC-2 type transport system permease protein